MSTQFSVFPNASRGYTMSYFLEEDRQISNTPLPKTGPMRSSLLYGLGAAACTAVGISLALEAAGFTEKGVTKRSLAACIQTANTVAGSLFSWCQSAGASGVNSKDRFVISASVGIAVTAGVLLLKRKRRQKLPSSWSRKKK